MVNGRTLRISVLAVLGGGFLAATAACSKPRSDSSSTAVTTASAAVTASATPSATPPVASKEAPVASAAAPVASAAPLAPACKAGEVVAYKYDSTSTPICGHPCKQATDCAADQDCSLQAARSLEPTMGMAAAKANEIMLCAPKASAATCKEGQVFGFVAQVPERGFCSKKCSVDSDCLKGQICVEGHTVKGGGDVIHMCIAKPVK